MSNSTVSASIGSSGSVEHGRDPREREVAAAQRDLALPRQLHLDVAARRELGLVQRAGARSRCAARAVDSSPVALLLPTRTSMSTSPSRGRPSSRMR